jgi:hypothetical protein
MAFSIQLNDIQHNDIQHNGIQLNDTLDNDIQLNKTFSFTALSTLTTQLYNTDI